MADVASRDALNNTRATEKIYSLLSRPTAKQRLLARLYRPPHNVYQPFCHHLTEQDCSDARQKGEGTSSSPIEEQLQGPCSKVHFEVVRYPQTDDSMGHCSYLSTCHRTATCKYLHFRPVPSPNAPPYRWQSSDPHWTEPAQGDESVLNEIAVQHPRRSLVSHGLSDWLIPGSSKIVYPPQWINADLQTFDLTILGKFDVIHQDTAFDIHMSLPYGTMTDASIRAMPIQDLQDTGFIFFWVTGRAMELGRELLDHWGYERVGELIWVKVGQTQRLIRTGRTGHWINHTKEHCLIGAKNANLEALSAIPDWAQVGLDSDVLVSEVRDTSRKPDEIYGIMERLAPGGKKLELFGRRHNARSGWLTVGNQLKSDQIFDPELQKSLEAYRSRGQGTPTEAQVDG